MSYEDFIDAKTHLEGDHGFEPVAMPDAAFDFQRSLIGWSTLKGRAAILADCGLGKSLLELAFGDNVVRHTNGRVLHLCPLAVSGQMIREGERFGIEAHRSTDGKVGGAGIYVANYERLHLFDPADFAGIVCDESSILKSDDGATRSAVTAFARKLPYRLLCTATPSPNDFTELGTSSEALGYLGNADMLNRFFVNNVGNSTSTKRAWGLQGGGGSQWRFKGHAEQPFWRWVCSWARALRRPSDLGFSDARYVLPDLVERDHIVETVTRRDGQLFSLPAIGLAEEREERRRSLTERCERAASLVASTGQPAVMWCGLNDEGDLLERLVADAVQVSGRDIDEEKEEKFLAFERGEARVLVIKPKIGAWGLNWQHCAHMTTFASHSFEQYYQSVRRCWRFGQTRPVVVDRVLSSGETEIGRNLARKADQAERMFAALVRYMRDGMSVDRQRSFSKPVEVPSWL